MTMMVVLVTQRTITVVIPINGDLDPPGIQKSFTRTSTQLEVSTSLITWSRFSTLAVMLMLMLMLKTKVTLSQCLAGLATERAEKGGGVIKVGVKK